MPRVCRFVVVCAVALALLPGSPLWAAPSPQQRTKIREADEALKRAATLYSAKKFKDASEAITQAQEALAAVAAEGNSKDVARLTAPLYKRLKKAHALVELEGVKLPPLAEEPEVEASTGKATGKNLGKGGGGVSFTGQVAPVLVAKCGNCHVKKTSGGLSMVSYVSLQKGTPDGIVISRQRDGRGSRIVEVIESGDMPKGGGKVEPAELALIIKWINEGARFDGKDPNGPIAAGAAAPANPVQPAPKAVVARATGNEEVQFARDIGPVLLANCTGCHIAANPPMGFGMHDFNRLMRGSNNGPVVTPGKPDESLIIQKLRGTAKDGARMPLNKPPLADDVIEKFAKWIKLQARFDGPDPAQPLAEVVAIIESQNSTHDELSRKRADLAARNWRIALPDIKPDRIETKNFLIYGTVGESTLNEVGKVAEEQVLRLEKVLKLAPDEPLVKGRMTLYVFHKHFDYGEIGERLERRPIPAQWRGHWTYTITDAYGCVMPAANGEYSLSGLLAQQLTGVHVASLGSVPRWFAEGSARATVARLEPKDPRVKAWDSGIAAALSSSDKPDSFLTSGLSPEDTDILSYSFVKYLMAQSARYQSVLTAVHSGTPFDQAFAKAYGGGSPSQVAAGWASKAVTKRGR